MSAPTHGRRVLPAVAVCALALAGSSAPALGVGGGDTLVRVAGTGVQGFLGDGGPATSAQLNRPRSAAADAAGNVYIAMRQSSSVRKVSPDGRITRVAGVYGSAGYNGDGIPGTTAHVNGPSGVAVDGAGNVYIADEINQRIRKLLTSGIIETLAPGVASPLGIAVDGSGNVYAAAWGAHLLLRINPAGAITVLAGTGTAGYNGDDRPANTAQLNAPGGVAVDESGVVYVADTGNGRIRRIGTDGIIRTVAPVTAPGIAVDRAGNIYLAEQGAHRVRKIDRQGVISTIAGTGAPGLTVGPGPARNAQLNAPFGLSVDSTGSLLIGDEGSHTVRRIINIPPTAAFAAAPPAGPAPLGVAFDGTHSSDPNDAIISYRWSFGDGAAASGPTVSHTYAAPGTYAVRLEVMDDSGATAATTQHVQVDRAVPPPDPIVQPPAPGLVLSAARFRPRWRASVLRGRLAVTVHSARPTTLSVRVLRPDGRGRPLLTRPLRVPRAGRFAATVPLAPGLRPGPHLVRVVDVGATRPRLPDSQRRATLGAPPEGVVARATISTALGGRERRVIRRGPSIIFANFTFAARPKRGAKLSVTWRWSGQRGPIARNPKRFQRRLTAFVKSRGPLPAGTYRAELRAGKTLVAVARTRIR